MPGDPVLASCAWRLDLESTRDLCSSSSLVSAVQLQSTLESTARVNARIFEESLDASAVGMCCPSDDGIKRTEHTSARSNDKQFCLAILIIIWDESAYSTEPYGTAKFQGQGIFVAFGIES